MGYGELRARDATAGALLALAAACGPFGTAALAQGQAAPEVPAAPAAPGTLDAPPEQIRPGPEIGSPGSTGPVIVPPSGTDPGLVRTPPDGGTSTTPLIPPPGAPGGDPSVVPR
jgi:hypothetical protein